MKKILNKLLPPLSLLLTKGTNVYTKKSENILIQSKGSKKVQNIEMAVINHYKPIIKIEL
jgi:hypothetical protein